MEFLHTDREIAVILKPVGMDSEQEIPAAIAAAIGGEVFPVHRLDKNVGGCMVYARTRASAAALSRAVQDGMMKKEYVALVHGTVPESGDWEDLLWKDSTKNKVFVVRRERRGVKPARLEFTRLRSGDPSLVRILLHTGRSHQIRVQFASRRFPLLGDHKYGARDEFTAPMLYSCALTFPMNGRMLHFEAMPPWAQTQGSD